MDLILYERSVDFLVPLVLSSGVRRFFLDPPSPPTLAKVTQNPSGRGLTYFDS